MFNLLYQNLRLEQICAKFANLYCSCKFVLQIAVQLATFTQCVNLSGHGYNHELYLFLGGPTYSAKSAQKNLSHGLSGPGFSFCFANLCVVLWLIFCIIVQWADFFYQGCILYLLRYKIIWKSNLNLIFNFAPFPNKRTKLVTDNLFVNTWYK